MVVLGIQTVPTLFRIRFKYQQSRSREKQPTRRVGAVHQLSSTWFGGLALPRCFFFLSLSGFVLRLRQGAAEDCLGLAPGPNGRLCRHVSKLWGSCEPKKLEEKVISEACSLYWKVDGSCRVRKDMEQQALYLTQPFDPSWSRPSRHFGCWSSVEVWVSLA